MVWRPRYHYANSSRGGGGVGGVLPVLNVGGPDTEYFRSTVVRAAAPIISRLPSKPCQPLSLVDKRMSLRHLCLDWSIEAPCGPPQNVRYFKRLRTTKTGRRPIVCLSFLSRFIRGWVLYETEKFTLLYIKLTLITEILGHWWACTVLHTIVLLKVFSF